MFLIFLCLFPSSVHALELGWPIGCKYGNDCLIQNYVDMQAGEGYADYRCGHLTYDKHDGTDIRLRDFSALKRQVSVLAAADGKVAGIRDNMQDISVRETGADNIKNRECGNGVVLNHGEGWETQYCHMLQGSIRVRPGDEVKKGDVLGYVGLSGNTEFPHLHLSVRHNGQKLDPFTGERMEHACGGGLEGSLWESSVREKLAYQPTAILIAGVAGQPMSKEDFGAARLGQFDSTMLSSASPAMIVWMDIMGIREGDTLMIDFAGPEGFKKHFTQTAQKDQASYFYFTGLKNKGQGWQPGDYKATIVLTARDGKMQRREVPFSVQ